MAEKIFPRSLDSNRVPIPVNSYLIPSLSKAVTAAEIYLLKLVLDVPIGIIVNSAVIILLFMFMISYNFL